MEPTKARHPQLNYEYKIYRIIQGGLGIPNARLVLLFFQLMNHQTGAFFLNLTISDGSERKENIMFS